MKTLIIMRHAKAEASNPEGDHSRNLTARGRADAEVAAKSMRDLGVGPNIITSSTAARALQTADIVAAAFDHRPRESQRPDLYLAEAERLLLSIHSFDDGLDVAVLIGHNPGLLDLINLLLGPEGDRESLPTSAYAIVETEGSRWTEVAPGSVRISPIVAP
ncbi:MAG: histidine phosphatase family protein [Thermomicrobiales bacterium]